METEQLPVLKVKSPLLYMCVSMCFGLLVLLSFCVNVFKLDVHIQMHHAQQKQMLCCTLDAAFSLYNEHDD